MIVLPLLTVGGGGLKLVMAALINPKHNQMPRELV